MQIVDAATTMGVIFSCVGIGAFLGPVLFNLVTPPKCAILSCNFVFHAHPFIWLHSEHLCFAPLD